ncbi:hypothetical protein CVV68_01285 [Arthrobacter livingstonensis]|uniref:HTH luxR-type domain-containing protein n=1 Tax=Arthrobacter livingstonensis TaxID=670078 RepID=A0A2V5LP55_9MICC|nr:hypothetical protein [Arthrobacter livingstonensis]PYI69770.1 hypothetical protein CVV68_01285 [Arthrobacter livingstonensis]
MPQRGLGGGFFRFLRRPRVDLGEELLEDLVLAEIADRARHSGNTVKTFIRSCYRRIGVANRPNAILWGLEHGFIPDHKRVVPRP